MSKKKYYDASGNEIDVSKNDFDFCQKDEKIFDTKFEDKPTTFAKDAFKRFLKNKSSVVSINFINNNLLSFIYNISVFIPLKGVTLGIILALLPIFS